tara:strand:+ start:129 stop:353 length:225 start_codon:yes stop_codon:yes gene_type:complete
MPRAKKTTVKKFEQKEVREAFISCRQVTCDKIATTIAELAAQEDLTREQAIKITSVLQAVTNDSFSLVMSNKGL